MNKKLCQKDNIQHIYAKLTDGNVKNYRPIVFWSWNGELAKEELEQQIKVFKRQGIGGFVIHARAGLKTRYLSEEWFECVQISLETAKNEGLDVWIYDEYGWPSGFVGGELLQDERNLACFLRLEVQPFFDPSAFAVYQKEGNAFSLCHFSEQASNEKGEYYCVYLKYSNAYADILNPNVTKQFIHKTHELYYQRFKASFGKELVGFFTDEPQYYRYETPFSQVVENSFLNEYGFSLKKDLIWLFFQDEAGYDFRCKYYNLLNKLYCENFYKQLYDWCNAHDCMLTGHSVEETFHFTQMWGGADCASTYDYQHIPGMDNLTLLSPAELSAKLLGSAASQLGLSRCLTETFGCSGYNVSPMDLKRVTDKQYVCGVNYMCQHLYNYTNAGQGKIDHPPVFGRALPWVHGYRLFNDYVAKLGYILSCGTEQTDVAVLSPMQSVYLDYLRLNEEKSQKTDQVFIEGLAKLKEKALSYHILNEKLLLRHGYVKGNELCIGQACYKSIVLIGNSNMLHSTKNILEQFALNGGKIICLDSLPKFVDGKKSDFSFITNFDLSSTSQRTLFSTSQPIDYMRRVVDGKTLVFMVNQTSSDAEIHFLVPFTALDLLRGTTIAINKSTLLKAGDSLLAIEGESSKNQQISTYNETIPFKLNKTSSNTLVLDQPEIKLDDGSTLKGNNYALFEYLVKENYLQGAEVTFHFEHRGGDIQSLIIEKSCANLLTFNGNSVNCEPLNNDCGFFKVDVSKFVKEGKNTISYCADFSCNGNIKNTLFNAQVPESLRNCFTYDTFLEPIYIVGEFSVFEAGVTQAVELPTLQDLNKSGYKFFAGSAEYMAKFMPKSEEVIIELAGDFAMADVYINDTLLCSNLFKTPAHAYGLKKSRQYTLKIVCYSTLKNILGPFHSLNLDAQGVSPDFFTMRDKWDGLQSADYTSDYLTQPFGLTCVRLKMF